MGALARNQSQLCPEVGEGLRAYRWGTGCDVFVACGRARRLLPMLRGLELARATKTTVVPWDRATALLNGEVGNEAQTTRAT